MFLPGQHELLHFILCDQIATGTYTCTVTSSIPFHIAISPITLIIILILHRLTEVIRYACDYVVALQCCCRCRCVRQGGAGVGMRRPVYIIWSM